MNSDLLPICLWCKHLWTKSKRTSIRSQCDAFPDGIPMEIMPVGYNMASHDHRLPYPYDNGIQFEECVDELELRQRDILNRYLNAGITLEQIHEILTTILTDYEERKRLGKMTPKQEIKDDNP